MNIHVTVSFNNYLTTLKPLMRKTHTIILFLTISLFLNYSTVYAQKPMVGNDADTHGCRASAGYTFSIVKNECIKLWEQPLRLLSINPKEQTFFVAVVFSADKKRAEVFLPNTKAGIVLSLITNKSNSFWKKDDLILSSHNDGYTLKKAGKILFKEAIKNEAAIIDTVAAPILITLKDSSKTIHLTTNQLFNITLTECVGCRYVWTVETLDTEKISLLNQTFSNKTACKGCSGGNQDRTFHFKAVEKGNSTIELIYFKQKFSINFVVE